MKYLYFEGKIKDGFVVTAGCIYENEKDFKPLATKIDVVPAKNDNQFSIALKALLTAIECMQEKGIQGEIAILHQNNTLINWLKSGNCNDNYAGLFASAIEQLGRMSLKSTFFIKPIASKQNKAKKLVLHANVNAQLKSQTDSLTRLVFDFDEQPDQIGNDKIIDINQHIG